MSKLRGHGFSDKTIARILTDRFTFVRYLMPEAQSVLLNDKADFKAIMDFLFFAVSVCTDRRMNELLTKAFFDLVGAHFLTYNIISPALPILDLNPRSCVQVKVQLDVNKVLPGTSQTGSVFSWISI